MNKTFDELFDQINNLTWYPWVGENYSGLMILGESNYDKWDGIDAKVSKDWLSSKDFTRNRIVGAALKEHGEGDKIYRNLEKAVWGKAIITAEEREKLWNSSAFINMVQRPMSTNTERPQREDFREGWEIFGEISKILKPETVLVLGTTLQKIQTFRQFITKYKLISTEIESPKKNSRSTEINFNIQHESLRRITFLKHPSRSFKWEISNEFLKLCDFRI